MNEIFEYFKKINIEKILFPLLVLLINIICFIIIYYKIDNININDTNSNQDSSNIALKNDLNENPETLKNNDIYVDIKGEVKKPGVYKLIEGSRVNDLINIAGGLSKNANTRFINLSKVLVDGDVIVIYSNSEIKNAKKTETIVVETPCICEEIKNDACIVENTSIDEKLNDKEDNIIKDPTNEKININTAIEEELETLSGIGDSKAKAIIQYRNENGLFKSIEDLVKVSGISETIFSKIKENITI